jgi:hypothetical protein
MKDTTTSLLRAVRSCALPLTLALTGAATAWAQGSPLISANAYDTNITTLPQINALAYHSHNCSQLNTDLGRTPQNKPIIISDDGAQLRGCNATCATTSTSGCSLGLPDTLVDDYALAAKNAGRHYEHLSMPLSTKLEAGDFYTNHLDSWDDLTPEDQNVLKILDDYATPLAAGGSLSIATDPLAPSRKTFFWNSQPVTLMGFSVYGAITSNDVDLDGYLDAIRLGDVPGSKGTRKGVNFTRVWLLDQWASLVAGASGAPLPGRGVTPFTGDHPNYDLDDLSDELFARLRRFVNEAWERGIVVQVTLFDRNGVKSDPGYGAGGWVGSPYNDANNLQSYLPSGNLTNSHASKFLSLGCGTTSTNDEALGRVHRRLIQRATRELSGYGNVILEIMNEVENGPSTVVWSNQATWHAAVASLIDSTLAPGASLIQDDFSGSGNLNGDPTSQCEAVWAATNTSLSGGRAVNTVAGDLVASVPFVASDFQENVLSNRNTVDPLTVELSTELPDNGWVAVGFFDGTGGAFSNGELWMLVRRDGRWAVWRDGTALQIANGKHCLGAGALKRPSLRYNPLTNSVSAWVNDFPVVTNVALGSFVPNIQRAGFHAFGDQQFPAGQVQIEDFAVRVGTVTYPSPPTGVSVVAADAAAAEAGPDPGLFTISRLGSSASAITVGFAMSGTATSSSDYGALGTSVSLAASACSANVTLTPVDDPTVESSETALLTLQAGAGYTLRSPTSATVTIADNDSPAPTCTPTATALCLQGGRFRVTANVGGTPSQAVAHPGTTASGYFWAYDSTNLELAVKVLDGSAINGNYWAYLGAATDQAASVLVEDLVKGTFKTYSKTAGNYCGTADPGFFTKSAALELPAGPPMSANKAVCAPSSTNLCLLGNRFGVRVLYANTPVAGLELNDKTGSYTFFSPDNVEVFVKVLDGTAINGKYWVFFGSMTEQAYTIEIIDSVTGAVKNYPRTAAQANCGGGDTAAF